MDRLTEIYQKPVDKDAISLERASNLRSKRRRRVAKRMAKRFPLFAVEFMQSEFPGYQYEEWVQDVTRKSRKSKSIRHIKTKAFDWKRIRSELPEIFDRCIVRTKTKAVIKGKTSNGIEFVAIIRACWWGEYGESKLDTSGFIALFKKSIKDFAQSPAVTIHLTNHTLLNESNNG